MLLDRVTVDQRTFVEVIDRPERTDASGCESE